jgi:DNA-binding PadR family transcriptional regulator
MATGRRSGVLEFAILGLLHDAPMHGYELRKRCNAVMGSFRAISYGSLYPALRDLVERGLIAEAGSADASAPVLTGRRAKTVYELTPEGKDRFAELVSRTGPESWEDEAFGVHLAFFGSTPAEVRMRILEGRRSRMEERRANLHASMTRNRERIDTYTLALQRHGLEGVEREVRWLTELIEHEQNERRAGSPGVAGVPTTTGDTGAGPHRPRARG